MIVCPSYDERSRLMGRERNGESGYCDALDRRRKPLRDFRNREGIALGLDRGFGFQSGFAHIFGQLIGPGIEPTKLRMRFVQCLAFLLAIVGDAVRSLADETDGIVVVVKEDDGRYRTKLALVQELIGEIEVLIARENTHIELA